jgi:hypothetical protein
MLHPLFQIAQIQQRVSAGRSQQKPSKLKTDPEYGRRRYVKDAMNKEASFKIAPGGAFLPEREGFRSNEPTVAINRIEQHSGWLAIGAARAGGQADNPDGQFQRLKLFTILIFHGRTPGS